MKINIVKTFTDIERNTKELSYLNNIKKLIDFHSINQQLLNLFISQHDNLLRCNYRNGPCKLS